MRIIRQCAQQDGFALIGALWLLVVLSVVGLELGLQVKDQRLVAANRLEEARARAAAEAGLEHARARLENLLNVRAKGGTGVRPNLLDPWAVADSGLFSEPVPMERAIYDVVVRDLGERLNLNRATEDEIRRLLEALRIDSGRADRIAQSVLDWRDPDDFHRARGAEREWYERQGAAVLPRNSPFGSLAELLDVRDVTPEAYEILIPYLTLEGSGRVNLHSADLPVLLALPGMTEEAVRALMRLRQGGRRLAAVSDLGGALSPPAQEAFQAALPSLMSRVTLETEELEVISEGRVDDGRIRVHMAATLVRSGRTVFLVSRAVR